MGEASPPASLGRAALERLLTQYGVDTIKGWVRDFETAHQVKRKPGRPLGSNLYDNDMPLLQAAAARWREAGGGAVWPFLLEIGGSEVAAKRLHRRLIERNSAALDRFAQHSIADFHAGAWLCKFERARPADNVFLDMVVHTLAAGYRHRHPIDRTDAQVLFQNIPVPTFVFGLVETAVILAACPTWSDAKALMICLRDSFPTHKNSRQLAN